MRVVQIVVQEVLSLALIGLGAVITNEFITMIAVVIVLRVALEVDVDANNQLVIRSLTGAVVIALIVVLT